MQLEVVDVSRCSKIFAVTSLKKFDVKWCHLSPGTITVSPVYRWERVVACQMPLPKNLIVSVHPSRWTWHQIVAPKALLSWSPMRAEDEKGNHMPRRLWKMEGASVYLSCITEEAVPGKCSRCGMEPRRRPLRETEEFHWRFRNGPGCKTRLPRTYHVMAVVTWARVACLYHFSSS